MSVSGLCQVCSSAAASHRCSNCGALVCEEHYDHAGGRCVDCAGPGGGRQV